MPKVVRTNFLLKHPDFKGRDAFSITVREILDEGKPKYSLLKNDRLNALNKQWQKSKKTVTERDRLLFLAKEIRAELNRIQRQREGRERLLKQSDNIQILNDFIETNLEGRGIKSEKDQINDFTRAVYLLENVSLKTATIKVLQKQVDKIEKNSIHRRTCSRLNSLLAFYGRGERLRAKKYNLIPFIISEENFLRLLPQVEVLGEKDEFNPPLKNLFVTLFYTGMRTGEAFALSTDDSSSIRFPFELNHIQKDLVKVNSQMERIQTKDRKIQICLPKTGKERTTIISNQQAIKSIKEWAQVPIEKKYEMRFFNYSAILKRALQKAFPSDYHKHFSEMKLHDLRHSYATSLLQKGLGITHISKLLGNSVLVCEKYYLRHSYDEEGMSLIRSILTENTAKIKIAS